MLKLRQAKESDKAFIYSTMLRGLYYGCEYFGQINKQTFFQNYAKVVDKLLDVADVNVVCLSEDEDTLVGFAITRPNIVDYVFVKQPWRKQGVAKMLVATAPQYATHTTKPGAALIKKYNLQLNPWLL